MIPSAAPDSSSPSGAPRLAGPILLCAATRWEADPLARRWSLRSASSLKPNRYEGLVRGRRVTLIKTGMGPRKAASSVEGLVSPRERFACLVSTGLAGALACGILPGDLVADLRGFAPEALGRAQESAGAAAARVHFGSILSAERLVISPRRKALLGESSRSAALDMETGALRAWGEGRGTPVAAVRAIFDTLQDGPLFWLNIPGMARRRKKAMEALGAFLEEFLPGL